MEADTAKTVSRETVRCLSYFRAKTPQEGRGIDRLKRMRIEDPMQYADKFGRQEPEDAYKRVIERVAASVTGGAVVSNGFDAVYSANPVEVPDSISTPWGEEFQLVHNQQMEKEGFVRRWKEVSGKDWKE